jgi:arylsulfatase A-like enzyme
MNVLDIAPTILAMYGIPQPPQMKGRVLSEIFHDAARDAVQANSTSK